MRPNLLLLSIATLAAFFTSTLTGCADRVCSLDQSSMFLVKCWGDCPNADSVCRLRWRALGTEDDWITNHQDYRYRDEDRDMGLEYSCFCEQPEG